MIVGNHKIHYLHQTTTTSSDLIFCLLRDIFLRSLSTKFPLMMESRPCYICKNHLSPLCEALTRGRGAAEQDFCANILGAKQHVFWGGVS